jgi:hypothetical protein
MNLAQGALLLEKFAIISRFGYDPVQPLTSAAPDRPTPNDRTTTGQNLCLLPES